VSCLDPAQIARAATLEALDPHARECFACRRKIDDDRATRDAVRRLAMPALATAHRKELAAEILARAAFLPHRRRWPTAVAGVLAAAAATLVIAWPRHEIAQAPSLAATSEESTTIAASNRAPDDAPPAATGVASQALRAPSVEATRGTAFEHRRGDRRDTVTLDDGALALDTRSSRPVDVRVGDTVVRVDDAAVTIRAHEHAIVSVHVVVGSAKIETDEQHVTLQREAIWTPGPTAKQRSLAAFRDAWIALRAGKHAEAIALFDQVTDPVALEEASYWAAVAARRANDPSADARAAKFLAAFPQSAYAAELRSKR
jgi:hypothetical protein